MKENKKVTYHQLSKGQKIEGTEESGSYSSFTAYVKNINAAYVTVEMWHTGGEEKRLNSDVWFLVPMSETEIIQKYNKDAEKIVEAIQKPMSKEEIGYKEMWNAWLSPNPWEMAQYCREHKITILGHCKDIVPKEALFSGDILDVGICAEDEDGDRFWCHFRASDIWKMKRVYEKWQEYVKNGNIKDKKYSDVLRDVIEERIEGKSNYGY